MGGSGLEAWAVIAVLRGGLTIWKRATSEPGQSASEVHPVQSLSEFLIPWVLIGLVANPLL